MFKGFALLFCMLFLSNAALITPLEYRLHQHNTKVISKKLDNANIFGNSRGPGINWTWTNWEQGPTCPDSVTEMLDIIDLNMTTEPFRKVFASIDALVDDALAQLKALGWNHGISLGITYNGKTIFTSNKGTIDKDKNIKPTSDSIFAIASNTKIFTSLMLMDLVSEGIVNLEDPVSKFYNAQNPPEFKPVNPYGSKSHKSVTLQSLSSHTSGLPRELGCGISAECKEDAVMKYINAAPLFSKPMRTPHYSNLGTSLLARCLERAYNKATLRNISYEDWIQEFVFNKIDMANSGFNYSSEVVKKMAYGYTIDSNGNQIIDPLFATEQGWGNGCGGIHSSITDILKFLSDILKEDESKILTPDAYELYTRPGITFPDGLSQFGLGTWETVYTNGFYALTKAGLVGGFGSSFILVPRLKLGVAMWLNLETNIVTDQLGPLALNLLIPTLVSELRANKVERPLPANVDEIVGDYKEGDVVYFSVFKKTAQQKAGPIYGILGVGGPKVELHYNEEYTKALGSSDTHIAFTIREIPTEETDSCLSLNSEGIDNSIVYFEKINGKFHVVAPNPLIWGVPKA